MPTPNINPAANLLRQLAAIPPEDLEVVHALAVFLRRLGRLSPADQKDVRDLLLARTEATAPDDVEAIDCAVQQILAQQGHKTVPLEQPAPPAGARKAWADAVGREIRLRRRSAGLTQGQLAERADLPQSHISRLEHGVHTASHFTLEKIAAALGVGIDDLMPRAADAPAGEGITKEVIP